MKSKSITIKQIIKTSGLFLLLTGTVLNTYDALTDYGLASISLHPRVAAQAGGVNGTKTGLGEQLKTDVECTVHGSSSSTNNTSSTTSSGGILGGDINVGFNGIGGSLGGSTSSSSGSSSNSVTTENNSYEATFMAVKYYCGYVNYVSYCSITNPCIQ